MLIITTIGLYLFISLVITMFAISLAEEAQPRKRLTIAIFSFIISTIPTAFIMEPQFNSSTTYIPNDKNVTASIRFNIPANTAQIVLSKEKSSSTTDSFLIKDVTVTNEDSNNQMKNSRLATTSQKVEFIEKIEAIQNKTVTKATVKNNQLSVTFKLSNDDFNTLKAEYQAMLDISNVKSQ